MPIRYDGPPLRNPDTKQHLYQIAQVVLRLLQGKTNNIGSFELVPAVAEGEIDPDDPTREITINDPLCNPESFIDFMPLTIQAAQELASNQMYVSEQSAGTFTVTHRDTTTPDRIFRYIIIG